MARIENHNYSVKEAFRECFYIVPDYQCEYVWIPKVPPAELRFDRTE